MEPLAISLMIQAMRGDTLSALPNAPVEPVRTPRHRGRPVRRATAAALHHLADLVEPRIA
jgi:hypothetical protein